MNRVATFLRKHFAAEASEQARPARRLSGQRGFTLTETLVALGVLGICLTAILPMFYAAQLSMSDSDDKQAANAILERYFDEILTRPWDEIGADKLNSIVGGTNTSAIASLKDDGVWLFRHRLNENQEVLVMDDRDSTSNPNLDAYILSENLREDAQQLKSVGGGGSERGRAGWNILLQSFRATFPERTEGLSGDEVEQLLIESYRFNVDARLYYDFFGAPNRKIVTLEVRYVPSLRRLTTAGSEVGDPDRGVNVIRIKRVIPRLRIISEPET